MKPRAKAMPNSSGGIGNMQPLGAASHWEVSAEQ